MDSAHRWVRTRAVFAMALATGDPRLLKGSLITGGVAVVFLATAFGRRPLTLAAAQMFEPDRTSAIAEEFRWNAWYVRRLTRR